MKLTVVLDVLGVLALIGFAYLCWPPAALLVFGVAVLGMSFVRAGGGRK